MLTIKELKRCATTRLAINPTNLALAHEALNQLWSERPEERGYEKLPGRGASCKFAALLAGELFGGRLGLRSAPFLPYLRTSLRLGFSIIRITENP